MHTVDVVAVCLAVLVFVVCAAILARQRYMLRVAGAIPLAVRRGHRWLYGVARYVSGELRWYRSLGLGTRPTRVFRQATVVIVSARAPSGEELRSLPASALVVTCRDDDGSVTLALGVGAFTGFQSWIEASRSAGPR